MAEEIIYTMKGVSKVYPPNKYVLKDIYLSYFYGAKIGVLGLNGSGKSSLLLSIINEMLVGEKAKVNVAGSIAYSPQNPWIMSKTLKQNITFLSELDENRLKDVLHFACLKDDM